MSRGAISVVRYSNLQAVTVNVFGAAFLAMVYHM